MLPIYIEAEYADGYVHREDEQDHSPYVSGANIFNDILEGRPSQAHGGLVRFSLILVEDDTRVDVDWTLLPDNARPIRFKHMEVDTIDNVIGTPRIVGIDFGYQYTDEATGENVQDIQKIR